ncbi:hypothetical protein GO491_06080 [Flavobacteriaceae bacterium Ap0902]|nr:hypothetical protein [Flavobacteriaceae bacterium Ap0902]
MKAGLMQNQRLVDVLSKKWNILPFKRVLRDSSGGNLKIKSKETVSEGNIPVIDQGKDFIAGYTNQEDSIVSAKLPLIVFGDHTRILKYVDFEFAMGADGTKILEIINDEAYPKFIYYFLKSINIIDTGYNRHFKYVKDLVFPLPPLETQKKIAEILDNAAALKDKTQQLLTEYDALAQSIFLDMFGDPVNNPKGWESYKVIDVCNKITDGTHDTPERINKGVKFITGKHIRPYIIDYENSDYVSEDVHEIIYRRCNPEYHDVLYTNIGANLGTAALNTVSYEFSMKNVALLKCNTDYLIGRYLEYFLNNETMKNKIIWISSIGGAQKFLSLTQLRKLKITLPPIELQNEFAEKIALIEKQKELAKQELKESEDLFNALLQKAFKGELV